VNKVLLFVNGGLGLKVINILETRTNIAIVGVVVNSPEKRNSNYISQLFELSPTLRLFEYTEDLWKQSEFQDVLNESNLAVSALFGHIIPSEIVKFFGLNIFNLHPSLLPLGRGADPIPWAIIENIRQGVTIHIVEEKLDSGPIISQSEIMVTFGQTAGEIYELAIEELVRLFQEFIENWPNIIKIESQSGASRCHNSSELRALRIKLIQGDEEIEHSLRVIQALTFSDGRTARLGLSNGELWDVSLSMIRVEE
jgi:methionyl-tRNA formyltransferase